MFTGIIEELGTVQGLDLYRDSARLTILANRVLEETLIGDSIAVNGVCLTVTELSTKHFSVDIMKETLEKTNLKYLKPNSQVNLERALQLKTRLGGHLVSGHIDGTGKITAIDKVDIARVYKISTSKEITELSLPKGSIAVDGISLTIVEVGQDYFTISLIPHTFKNTTLGYKTIGDLVNLETDLIGKYVAKVLQNQSEKTAEQKISLKFLTEHGFL
ncbi:MAG: riboflavin synthase [Desulfitobacteriia bacterium]